MPPSNVAHTPCLGFGTYLPTKLIVAIMLGILGLVGEVKLECDAKRTLVLEELNTT